MLAARPFSRYVRTSMIVNPEAAIGGLAVSMFKQVYLFRSKKLGVSKSGSTGSAVLFAVFNQGHSPETANREDGNGRRRAARKLS